MKALPLITLLFTALTTTASALDIGTIGIQRPNSSASQAPILSSHPLQIEVGTRYWLSNGGYVKNLYDTTIPNQQNSRLSYSNITGQSSEVFWRVDHETGIFSKGFLGGGSLVSGKMNDEDFSPATSPYSNTIQVQSGGSLKYLTVDVGYNILKGNNTTGLPFKIGTFVGYNNYHERLNTFGCSQVGSNPYICRDLSSTISDSLDANTSWNSLRVGLGGEVTLLPGVRLSLEGAWLRNWFYAADYHNFRPDIRGISETGSGQGAQVEGVLSYDLTPRFSLGVGGRYWIMNSQSKAHWEQTIEALYYPLNSAPITMYSQRYGGFLQASYRFGGPNDKMQPGVITANFAKAENEPHNWDGIYLGGSTGYGFGNTGITTYSSLSPISWRAQGKLDVPSHTRSDIAGFIGGGQIGYNHRLKIPIIIGIETDLSYANIGGSIGTPGLRDPFYTTSKSLLNWLGTLRGRGGYLIRDDFLVYATAGFSFGDISARASSLSYFRYSNGTFISLGEFNNIQTGWSAGAGLEYAVAKNLSLKAEWLYIGFGNQTYGVNPISGASAFGYNATTNNDTQLIKTGVNYSFN